MGQKSASETLIAIVAAFHERRRWRQADLARDLETDSRTVRRKLNELCVAGFPLKHTHEPPDVWWELPKDWVAGGIAIADRDIAALIRIVARAPKTGERDRMLARLLAAAPASAVPRMAPGALLVPERAPSEEEILAILDAGVAAGRVVRVHYASARGDISGEIELSVQRIDVNAPARVIGVRDPKEGLRWFRVDRMKSPRVDASAAFVRVAPEEIDRFVKASVDGFHGGRQVASHWFLAKDPGWIRTNLMPAMRAVSAEEHLRVEVETSGIEQVARFVVGLGGAVVRMDEALAPFVAELAEGALTAARNSAG